MLTALADFIIVHKQEPSNYLKKSISDALQTFFQSSSYQSHINCVNPQIGFICEKIILLKINLPSNECLKTIVHTCWTTVRYNYIQQKSNESITHFFLLINLNKILNAFLTWNIDGDKYHEGFWLAFLSSVECLLKNKLVYFQPNDDRGLVMEIFKNILLAVLKFHKIQQFKIFESFWLEYLEENFSIIKHRRLKVNTKNDIKIIEEIIKNKNFVLFRPVITKFSKIC